MKRKFHRRSQQAASMVLMLALLLSNIPIAFAGQVDGYRDPAEDWKTAGSRTNELDVNAVVTKETFHCDECLTDTNFQVYRVPEYTRSGETAFNRGVMYSDGTCIDGASHANQDEGTPGVNATYTGYHWTKAVCDKCGTINSNQMSDDYSYGKNVYWMNDCAASFYKDLPETKTYEQADREYHTVTTTSGRYCQFCNGTDKTVSSRLEHHDFDRKVVSQLAHQRFVATDTCEDCEYSKTGYVGAKSVVANYYGVADGKPHTLTVTELSDAEVSASIRYGNSAESCTLTSAPNYIEEGQYTVYYEISYTYESVTMTENGVAYVWLRPLHEETEGDGSCGDGIHKDVYHDTVEPSCTSLGYDRYLCTECGRITKQNYKESLGHAYAGTTVREATCEADGKVLEICIRCGDVKVTATPKTEHEFATSKVQATCTSPGYTLKECGVCGERFISNVTETLPHDLRELITRPTCTTSGLTVHLCANCGLRFSSDYTDAMDHQWDEGKPLTNPTCGGEGVLEYTCKRCSKTKLIASSATGHNPGPEATCTTPQICLDCGAVLVLNGGHKYRKEVTPPTCTEAGYTTYTCANCGNSYTKEPTDPLDHSWDGGKQLTVPTCGGEGVTVYTCERCKETKMVAVSAKGHNPGAEATCTAPQLCQDCGAILELPTGHHYVGVETPPTCTDQGYTTFTCSGCGTAFVKDYTDPVGHQWDEGKPVTTPTCGGEGVTVYTCVNCEKTKLVAASAKGHTPGAAATCMEPQLCRDCEAILTLPTGHHYESVVTPPTCTEDGYTTDTCTGCDDQFTKDPTEALDHQWNSGEYLTVPTCSGEGVTVYTCERCSVTKMVAASATGHTPGPGATCTSPQTCTACSAILAIPAEHQYDAAVTAPTCTEMGFTTYTCKTCGDTYNGEYKDPAGHTPSDWIVDQEATEKAPGQKHTECTACHIQLETAVIDQIYSESGTDGYGQTKVGSYTITVTDSKEKPIQHATATLNQVGTIMIQLPTGHLLDREDQTIVTVVSTESGDAVEKLLVHVADKKKNCAQERTDNKGQIKVPLSSTTTDADGNGTVGSEDEDKNSFTYVVVVTDKNSRPIENATITIGKTGNITVQLPDGFIMNNSNPITITVKDPQGNPQNNIHVIVKGDRDQNEQGDTNKDGKLTVPTSNSSDTDETGSAIVGSYTVIVTDQKEKPVKKALVTLHSKDDEDSFTIELPSGRLLDGNDPTVVTVLLPTKKPATGLKVEVRDKKDNHVAKNTDKSGQIKVPDATGLPGEIVGTDTKDDETSNTVNVTVTDKKGKPVEDAKIGIDDDGKVTVTLPKGYDLDTENPITVKVTDNQGKPKEEVSVQVKDRNGDAAQGFTDEKGKVTVPSSTHHAYVEGMPDGSFRPDTNMTRSEAAAVFARVLADVKGDTVGRSRQTRFPDIANSDWFYTYVTYLEQMGIVVGFDDQRFHATETMTRAQFVTMCVRLSEMMDLETASTGSKGNFSDVSASHWAAANIRTAARNGWIVGQPDGTFQADRAITRAEVCAVINRMLGREADEAFVRKNLKSLHTFYDLQDPHYWAYYEIMEAANSHQLMTGTDKETWEP